VEDSHEVAEHGVLAGWGHLLSPSPGGGEAPRAGERQDRVRGRRGHPRPAPREHPARVRGPGPPGPLEPAALARQGGRDGRGQKKYPRTAASITTYRRTGGARAAAVRDSISRVTKLLSSSGESRT